MKKTLALVLSLFLCLAAFSALAERVPFASFYATIDLGDGLTLYEEDDIPEELVEEFGAFALILDEANQACAYFLFNEIEDLEYIDASALNEEELLELAVFLVDPLEVTEAMVLELDSFPMLAVSFLDENGIEQNCMIELNDGCYIGIHFGMLDGSAITPETGKALLEAVMSIQFVEE